MDWLHQLQDLGVIALAMLFGGFIGLEREVADKPAGLRTHILVAGAAALLVRLSDSLLLYFARLDGVELVQADPIRIMQAIVVGISFLGAGTIFRRGGDHVEGLTTAASILFVSAIGMAVALEQWALAFGMTLLTLLVLRGLSGLERSSG